jgi:hypothetical protein
MGVVHQLFAVHTKCYCTVYNVHLSEELETKRYNAEFEQ